jgi:hypothetical protein
MSHRSHLTQVMQNYFDQTDIRTRESPTSLEAQLLNLPAVELESLTLRIARETSQTLQTVPTNIDNGGVYNAYVVPDAFLTGPDQTTFTSILATVNAVPIGLLPYDDSLPQPSNVVVDTTHPVVPMANPVLFTLIGAGDDLTQTYAVQKVEIGTLPVPNVLTVWVDQVGLNSVNVTITITGIINPEPAWVTEKKTTVEVLQISSEGEARSRNRWASISKIEVRNLPVGMRLRGWSLPFNLPASPDPLRPYTTPQDRDVLFKRYWQISSPDNLIYELYIAGGLTGLEIVNSYAIHTAMVDLAVEPYTNGMFVASSDTLYYVDRREYQADLSTSGISSEPLYGLQVIPDVTKPGPTRYVVLSGIPYANSANIFQYRYVVTVADSLSIMYSILPDGSIGPSNAGWRSGAPAPVSFALNSVDYEFRLEMQDINGTTTYDVVPYRNATMIPLSTVDMSTKIDSIKGIAFDSYGQLWAWNGSFAIPLSIQYQAYVFDADSKTLFSTQPFTDISIVL